MLEGPGLSLPSPLHRANTRPPRPDTGEETTHLPKVSDIEEVKGVKQLAVSQSKFIVADFKEGTDVLQAQELEKRREEH